MKLYRLVLYWCPLYLQHEYCVSNYGIIISGKMFKVSSRVTEVGEHYGSYTGDIWLG